MVIPRDLNKTKTITTMKNQENITPKVIEPSLFLAHSSCQHENFDALRLAAIHELLEKEINYVKLLSAICNGYLPAMSNRLDIFSASSIGLIFSNITAIYKFQRMFLEALRQGIEQNQISKVFLKMHKGFLCYLSYCNDYSRALVELETYERITEARTILENCRESDNLAKLPLSAHLLAPVQRICRYPLHLNELLRNALKNNGNKLGVQTDILDYEHIDVLQFDIPDTHSTVKMALKKMRGITEAVNEGRRQSEILARLQGSFQSFKGPLLSLHSTRFFLQGDAMRQNQNMWNSSCTLFLFDNQLIYCKRDIIKRSQFIYRGRIFLDRCRIVNMQDGNMFGPTVKNMLRFYCQSREKWYDFSFRSAIRKHAFLNALALERQFSGKTLEVSEMTGFEFNEFDEEQPGDFSDQSEYEYPDCEHTMGSLSSSGDNSGAEFTVKSTYRSCAQWNDDIASTSHGSGQMLISSSAWSLSLRRLSNWFRKLKNFNGTANPLPTHNPDFDADSKSTTSESVQAASAQIETGSSFA
ncbi:rho guanine nucleotide exchange factor 4-like [Drosophila novamexicana]|uniref:rho guanine nucleotide exchange factor 4-like n=1 Tax=Drosophila novamexicana TaxID=47314 RepID=UPI0011E5F3D8|nr:rho guanine nucleotide exchange factor 4-like [Drosophila novamexicana]XP_030571965.1 rho guanine nucleotide exchange factor 4-like [Drosophila novamexicana]